MPVAVPRSPVKKAVCIGVEYVELAKLNPDWNLTGTYADTLKLTKLLESKALLASCSDAWLNCSRNLRIST